MLPFILKSNSISMFPPGAAPVTIHSDHMNYSAVYAALTNGRYDEAVAMATVKSFVTHATGGLVTVTDEGVFYDNNLITGYLTDKIIEFVTRGLPINNYCLFLNNLMANPSMVSRTELYLFLEAANLPITEDGCFIAYKAVTSDFKDMRTGKFDNSPGAVLEMPRRDVDDNRDRTCSYGFHAAAYNYAKNFMSCDGRLVAVKINPADVVSVPSDYNNQKLRCCKYEVLWDIPDAADTLTGQSFVSTGVGFNEPEWDDYYSDDDDDDNYHEDYDGYDLIDDDEMAAAKTTVEKILAACADAAAADDTNTSTPDLATGIQVSMTFKLV